MGALTLVSQAWKPERETSSSLHMSETEKWARSAAMKRKHFTPKGVDELPGGFQAPRS